ncbi:hypothetical protein [Profundibacter sp.]
MELVRDNVINEVFRAIAMVFALVLGSCGEPTTTGVLPSPMSGAGLPVILTSLEDSFEPKEPVKFQNGFNESGLPIVTMQFGQADRVTLGEFTGRHIGEPVVIRVCDETLDAAVVQEAITGGSLVLMSYDAWGRIAEFLANGCP